MNEPERQARLMLYVLLGMTGSLLLAIMVLAWPYREQLPDFTGIEDVEERKSSFFNFLLPVVEAENRRLAQLRQVVNELARKAEAGERLTRHERRLLEVLAARYESPIESPGVPGFFDALLVRIDRIPASLVLAQAAMESGWGTSRFAREGLNLFGHWCEVPGCGIVPAARPEGATYEVAAFDSVRESVRKYMRNLNSHRAYAEFRQRRAELRRQGRRLSGLELASTLSGYSERGAEYIADIRGLIAANDLAECTRDPEVTC